jgi:hypothetical protein
MQNKAKNKQASNVSIRLDSNSFKEIIRNAKYLVRQLDKKEKKKICSPDLMLIEHR